MAALALLIVNNDEICEHARGDGKRHGLSEVIGVLSMLACVSLTADHQWLPPDLSWYREGRFSNDLGALFTGRETGLPVQQNQVDQKSFDGGERPAHNGAITESAFETTRTMNLNRLIKASGRLVNRASRELDKALARGHEGISAAEATISGLRSLSEHGGEVTLTRSRQVEEFVSVRESSCLEEQSSAVDGSGKLSRSTHCDDYEHARIADIFENSGAVDRKRQASDDTDSMS